MVGCCESGVGEQGEDNYGGNAKIRLEVTFGKITWEVVNALTTDSVGKMYGAFDGLRLAVGERELLLVVVGFRTYLLFELEFG